MSEHQLIRGVGALKHYEAALAVDPNNFDALIKAAHDAVDLGEFNPNADQRTALYRRAEQYARRAVAANPDDASEVMRLSGFSRIIAKNFLGGRIFDEASWDRAQKYLEDAVALEPNRITRRVDLAAIYVDRGQKGQAVEQSEWIASAPVLDYNDRNYKAEAERRLKALRYRPPTLLVG